MSCYLIRQWIHVDVDVAGMKEGHLFRIRTYHTLDTLNILVQLTQHKQNNDLAHSLSSIVFLYNFRRVKDPR
jgi:hypothetical protein